MMISQLLLLAFAGFAASERQLNSVTTNQQTRNVSILWEASLGKGSADIPLNDSRLAPTGGPEQVHLTYVNSSSVVVSWATGNASLINAPVTLGPVTNPYGNLSTVNITTDTARSYPVSYGTSATNLTMNATGQLTTYAQIYTGFVNGTGFANSNPIQNYTSPMLHHVELYNLKPNTTYFYQVSGGGSVTSGTFNFSTPPAVGSFPLRLGVFADVGQTYNSSDTLTRLLQAKSDALAFIGDYSYADDYTTNGTSLVIGFPNNTFTGDNITSPSGSYQPRWDSFFRLAQPLFSHIPLIPNAGNHELEPEGDGRYFTQTAWGLDNGRQFNSYLARIPTGPIAYQSGGAALYYSTEIGPVHYIVLNNYENFLVGSPQFNWLRNNLATVDRTRTPWVVASWHAPYYSSYTTHYKETESMRVTIEALFRAGGVDISLHGHLHEYERTHAMYNYQTDDCGTVYIDIGDAGNIEGLYTTFIDEPGAGNCPTPGAAAIPNYQPGPYTPSFTYDQNNLYKGYCPTPEEGQPSWSAYRQPAFGQGLLTFINETTAHWQWNRDIDASATNYPDDVYIIRNRSCFNYQLNGPAMAPLLSPQVASYVNSSLLEPVDVPTVGGDYVHAPAPAVQASSSAVAGGPTVSANSPVGGQYLAASG